MRSQNKKGQTWSFDLIVAVILFLVIVALFYAFLTREAKDETPNELLEDAKMASTKFFCDASEASTLCFIEDGEVDRASFNAMTAVDYNTLKQELGVEGEFCIYLRDETGRVIPVVDSAGREYAGFGDSTFRLNEDTYCGQEIV